MSSETEFGYSLKYNTHCIFRNISNPKKTVKIFNAPINYLDTRDILSLKGVSEEDIRVSLLKGVLRHKLLCKDIELVSSNIDLLQFSNKQRSWLQSYGFTEGVTIGVDELSSETIDFIESHGGGSISYLWRQEIPLIGTKNGSNRIFYTSDKFLNGTFSTGDHFHISVKHNGKDLYESIDYTISESSGVGTGYDTINIFSFAPKTNSTLIATYVIAQNETSAVINPINIINTSVNYFAVIGDLILCDAFSANIIITLPLSTIFNKNMAIIIKKIDLSGNSVIITPASGQPTDLPSNIGSLAISGQSITMVSTGTGWIII